MSDLAIPARHSHIEEFASAQADVTGILQGEFVEVAGATVDRAATPFATRIVGIADMDQVDGRVAVYMGEDSVKVPGETGNTIAINDHVYLATSTTVEGEPEAVATALAVGVCVEILGTAIVFRPMWDRMIAGADAT